MARVDADVGLALAGVDAVTSHVDWCTATVRTPAGHSFTVSAPPASTAGALAQTSAAWGTYRPALEDTVTICWSVGAGFLDGTSGRHTGCST